MATLTIFYDGFCPLCVREMAQLRRYDPTGQNITLVDIQHPEFQHQYPQIDMTEASRILLALTADGQILRGLDSTHAAWSAVGKGYRTAFLRWPLVRWLADRCYLWFAKHRYQISYWLTGQARCQDGLCARTDQK